MINRMDRYSIITLRKNGMSFRKISAQLGIDRKTVSKIWNQYLAAEVSLVSTDAGSTALHQDEITEAIVGEIKYDVSKRTKIKLTPKIQQRVLEILQFEDDKTQKLGPKHKQKMSATQVHQILVSEGYDIGVTTTRNFIRIYKTSRETFIRQEYEYGERLEYDFGEVKLVIDGTVVKLHLAVLSSPASGFRYAYLYHSQKQDVFLDSHVKFFEMMKGSYKEVVYDNMRNVVNKFLPNGEKILNDQCIKLALYYGFEINTTNTRKGNEKGSVENSVKVIRNQCFTKQYEFKSYDEACCHLRTELDRMNEASLIHEEKACLSPYRPPYELAEIETGKVNNYSCIRVDNNFYSVPDYLMSRDVIVKKYHDKILVYSHQEFVCEHKKIEGSGEYQLIMSHYLNTLATKPGALKHSLVLRQQPELYNIYHHYFKTRTKEFIAHLMVNRDKTMDELITSLKFKDTDAEDINSHRTNEIEESSRSQLKSLNQFMN